MSFLRLSFDANQNLVDCSRVFIAGVTTVTSVAILEESSFAIAGDPDEDKLM